MMGCFCYARDKPPYDNIRQSTEAFRAPLPQFGRAAEPGGLPVFRPRPSRAGPGPNHRDFTEAEAPCKQVRACVPHRERERINIHLYVLVL